MDIDYGCPSNYAASDADVCEYNDGTIVFDDTGWIEPSLYISQMLDAGRTLDEVRRGTYDYDGDDDSIDPAIDPTRSLNVDPADVDMWTDVLQAEIARKASIQKAAASAVSDVVTAPTVSETDTTPVGGT